MAAPSRMHTSQGLAPRARAWLVRVKGDTQEVGFGSQAPSHDETIDGSLADPLDSPEEEGASVPVFERVRIWNLDGYIHHLEWDWNRVGGCGAFSCAFRLPIYGERWGAITQLQQPTNASEPTNPNPVVSRGTLGYNTSTQQPMDGTTGELFIDDDGDATTLDTLIDDGWELEVEITHNADTPVWQTVYRGKIQSARVISGTYSGSLYVITGYGLVDELRKLTIDATWAVATDTVDIAAGIIVNHTILRSRVLWDPDKVVSDGAEYSCAGFHAAGTVLRSLQTLAFLEGGIEWGVDHTGTFYFHRETSGDLAVTDADLFLRPEFSAGIQREIRNCMAPTHVTAMGRMQDGVVPEGEYFSSTYSIANSGTDHRCIQVPELYADADLAQIAENYVTASWRSVNGKRHNKYVTKVIKHRVDWSPELATPAPVVYYQDEVNGDEIICPLEKVTYHVGAPLDSVMLSSQGADIELTQDIIVRATYTLGGADRSLGAEFELRDGAIQALLQRNRQANPDAGSHALTDHTDVSISSSAHGQVPVYDSGSGYYENKYLGVPTVCANDSDYGAVGDDSTDNLAAINAATAALGVNGGIVYFRPGTYQVSDTVVLPNRVSLRGETEFNTWIKAHSTFPVDTPLVQIGDSSSVFSSRVMDIGINCDHVSGSTGIFSEWGNEHCGVERVNIRYWREHALHFATGASLLDCHDIYCLCSNSDGDGNHAIYLDGVSGQTSLKRVTIAYGNVAVLDATNAPPIVVQTSAAHGCSTGDTVGLAQIGGNTAANGTWVVTYVDATHFSLDTSVGDGAYTSGGTVQMVGKSGVQINGSASVERIHVERYEHGVHYEASATGTARDVVGHSSVENLIYIANGGNVSCEHLVKNSGTNILVDVARGITETGSAMSRYENGIIQIGKTKLRDTVSGSSQTVLYPNLSGGSDTAVMEALSQVLASKALTEPVIRQAGAGYPPATAEDVILSAVLQTVGRGKCFFPDLAGTTTHVILMEDLQQDVNNKNIIDCLHTEPVLRQAGQTASQDVEVNVANQSNAANIVKVPDMGASPVTLDFMLKDLSVFSDHVDVDDSARVDGALLRWDNASTAWKASLVQVPVCLSNYVDNVARFTGGWHVHGGLVSLTTGDTLESAADIEVNAGVGKLLIVINAGSDYAGSITVTGTSVNRETGAETVGDTDTITVDALTTDGSDTDAQSNERHSFTGAYITSKWFRGTVTLSTDDLALDDVDVYQVAFEQLNDWTAYEIDTFDFTALPTNDTAWMYAYVYSLEVTGDKCSVTREATVSVASGGATANVPYRLRRGNIGKSMAGATDGFWVDVFFGPTVQAYWEDVNVKVWCLASIS